MRVIIETVVKPLKQHKADGIPLLTDSLPSIVGTLERSDKENLSMRLHRLLMHCCRELVSLTTTAENRKKRSTFERVVGGSNDASIIQQMNQDFDRALAAFQVGCT